MSCPSDICCNPIVKPVIFWNVWKIAGGHDTKRLHTITWDRFQRRCVLYILERKKEKGKGKETVNKADFSISFEDHTYPELVKLHSLGLPPGQPLLLPLGSLAGAKAMPGRCLCCFGKQQELQSLTQPAQHTEQNVSLMCNCWWCCKLRASGAPSPDWPPKAQSSPWWLSLSAFCRAPFPLSLWNHAIFCTYSLIHAGAHVQTQNALLFTADKDNCTLGLFGDFRKPFLQRGRNEAMVYTRKRSYRYLLIPCILPGHHLPKTCLSGEKCSTTGLQWKAHHVMWWENWGISWSNQVGKLKGLTQCL